MCRLAIRHLVRLAAYGAAALAAAAISAQATPVSYAVTLAQDAQSSNLDTPVATLDNIPASTTMLETVGATKIDALCFTSKDGTVFSLANNGGTAQATFFDGTLTVISFNYYGPQLLSFSIESSPGSEGDYVYVVNSDHSSGTTYASFALKATPLIPTPEPASFLMAASALLLGLRKLHPRRPRSPSEIRSTALTSQT